MIKINNHDDLVAFANRVTTRLEAKAATNLTTGDVMTLVKLHGHTAVLEAIKGMLELDLSAIDNFAAYLTAALSQGWKAPQAVLEAEIIPSSHVDTIQTQKRLESQNLSFKRQWDADDRTLAQWQAMDEAEKGEIRDWLSLNAIKLMESFIPGRSFLAAMKSLVAETPNRAGLYVIRLAHMAFDGSLEGFREYAVSKLPVEMQKAIGVVKVNSGLTLTPEIKRLAEDLGSRFGDVEVELG